MLRRSLLVLALAFMAGCTYEEDLLEPPVDLGNFQLGLNYVYAGKAQTSGAVSREMSEEELTAAVKEAIDARFGRYAGERRYHLGVSIEGYILGRAGVPVVAAPKSAMIIRVTVWDAEEERKLNDPPQQMTILENLDGESLLGTGWTQSAQKQLDGLARNAAKAIETFLVERNIREGWFMEEGYVPPPVAEPVPESASR